jgi:hypothetical protein
MVRRGVVGGIRGFTYRPAEIADAGEKTAGCADDACGVSAMRATSGPETLVA